MNYTESERRADWATWDTLLKETVHVFIIIIANVYIFRQDDWGFTFHHREKQQQQQEVLVYLPVIACELAQRKRQTLSEWQHKFVYAIIQWWCIILIKVEVKFCESHICKLW